MILVGFLMIRRTPRFTRTDTLFPDTTLFRSADQGLRIILARNLAQNIRAGDDHVAASGFHCVDQLGGQGMAVRFARMEKHFRKHAFLPRFGQDATPFAQEQSFALAMLLFTPGARPSVLLGKSGLVGVDLGGGLISKDKTNKKTTKY